MKDTTDKMPERIDLGYFYAPAPMSENYYARIDTETRAKPLQKAQYIRADLHAEVKVERDRLREALVIFYGLLNALNNDFVNSGHPSPIPMGAVRAKYEQALAGREEG